MPGVRNPSGYCPLLLLTITDGSSKNVSVPGLPLPKMPPYSGRFMKSAPNFRAWRPSCFEKSSRNSAFFSQLCQCGKLLDTPVDTLGKVRRPERQVPQSMTPPCTWLGQSGEMLSRSEEDTSELQS